MRVLLASLLLCGCIQWEGDLMGLFLPRQSILVPLGLVTQPNQYGQYPSGALKIARNFVMRNPGELVQAPDVQSVVSLAGLTNDVVLKLMPLDDGHVYAFTVDGTTWAIREGAGASNSVNTPALYSATDAFSSTGRISITSAGGRTLFNQKRSFLVADYAAPSTADERALRWAGLTQPRYGFFQNVENGNGVIPENHAVGYTACYSRILPSGQVVKSVPMAPYKVFNLPGLGPVNYRITFMWSSTADVRAGDFVEVYRTDLLSTTDQTADPGETFKRIISYEITTADVGAFQAVVTDRQPPVPNTKVTPGEELYTNPGQEGSVYANRQPPVAACSESFKGFVFFGNTTERAKFTFSVPGGIGFDIDAVANGYTLPQFKLSGIGERRGAGTVTNGSPVVTGITAADMVGVKLGQQWGGGGGFTGTPTVITVGASSFTMSANATSSIAAWRLRDVIEVNGFTLTPVNLGAFAFFGITSFEMTADTYLYGGGSQIATGLEITLEPIRQVASSQMTVRGTNGQNYSPPIPEIGATAKVINEVTLKNRIQWSKEQQPEHCPSVSEAFVGFGELYAMNSTRDALWIWCSDGLFRLSGDAGALGLGNWQIDYANSTLILAAPQASTVLNEFMYAYTNVGFVEVDSAGNVVNLTDKVIGDLLPGQKYIETAGIVVERNETDEEVLLILGENGNGSSNTVYVFNTKQRSWTTLGSNGASLTNITALAMQRSPVSGEPRTLFGVSPLAGGVPSYSGWNSTSTFLTAEVQYQPIYGDDPLDLKKWIWADYLFDPGSNAKTMVPTFNGTQYGGTVAIQTLDTNGAFARAGVPREVGLSHSISPGFRSLAGAPQSRFQGISIPVKPRTNQSKKR